MVQHVKKKKNNRIFSSILCMGYGSLFPLTATTSVFCTVHTGTWIEG